MSPRLARIPRMSLLSILLLALLVVSPTAAPVAPEAEEQRSKLEALRARISGLRAQMQSKSGEKNELSRLLQDAEKLIGRLARRLRVVDGRLSRQRKLLQDLAAEMTTQRQSLEQQRHVLARQVRAAYAMGRQERVKILLNQQDPATVSRVMVYYDYLNRVRAQKMEAIRGHMQRLAATEREIVDEEQKLARLLEEQQAEITAMKLSQDQRRGLVARLTRELNDQGQ
ncbi:MAG: hypothetical protein KJN79_02250, partial [Gammaproteobacteria bacterium]|nr:hypothetical protein [Gammaproteobacteria bacterium]